jgi:hypothetical protein
VESRPGGTRTTAYYLAQLQQALIRLGLSRAAASVLVWDV